MRTTARTFYTWPVVTRPRTAALLLLCVCLAAVAAGGCGADPRSLSARRADEAWEAYRERPGAQAFETFIHRNRTAAMEHGNPDDPAGIRYQLRALEVQALEAVRASSGFLAQEVAGRVDELERLETLAIYEEKVPGAAERLLRFREQVRPLLD